MIIKKTLIANENLRFLKQTYTDKIRLIDFRIKIFISLQQRNTNENIAFVTLQCLERGHYRYKLAAKTMSRLRSLMDSENLFSRSVFPMFFDA